MRARIALTAAAAVAALALAGCSSSSSAEPAPAAPAPADTATSAPATADTIVAVAAGNPDLSTLVTAVKAAGLAETLSGTGPFTVFAPTNEAFAALPAGVLDKLLLPENKEALTKILTYHVVPGKVTSDMISAGEVETVEGQKLTITTDGGVKVDNATVTTADVEASNGVVHVIDAVMIPSDVDPSTL